MVPRKTRFRFNRMDALQPYQAVLYRERFTGEPQKGDEIDEQARSHGVNYYEVTQRAARGDDAGLLKFFQVGQYADGAGAEEHSGVITIVIHLVGDDRLAAFVRRQSKAMRSEIREALTSGDVTFPFEAREYLRQHFPRSAAVLFRDR